MQTNKQTKNQHRYDKHLPLWRNVEVTVNSARFATYINELTDSRCSGDCWPIISWHCRQTVGRSVVYQQPTVGMCSLQWQPSIGWHATDNPSTIDRYLIDCQWRSIDGQSTVDQQVINHQLLAAKVHLVQEVLHYLCQRSIPPMYPAVNSTSTNSLTWHRSVHLPWQTMWTGQKLVLMAVSWGCCTMLTSKH